MTGYFADALLAAVLTGALCGLVGVLVVLRGRTFFAQALTHATFPGAVIAAVLGADVLLGSAASALILVGAMVLIGRVDRQGSQVASGIVLTAGFALGMVAQAALPGSPVQVESYLVGSILTVSPRDLIVLTVMLTAAVIAFALAGKELLFSTFDPGGFRAAGYRRAPVEVLALLMVTGTVVAALPAVGAVLAIALIAGPAATARLVASSILTMVVAAPLLGAVAGVAGLLASRAWATSAGASIAIAAALIFLVVAAGTRLRTLAWRGKRRALNGGEAVRSTS